MILPCTDVLHLVGSIGLVKFKSDIFSIIYWMSPPLSILLTNIICNCFGSFWKLVDWVSYRDIKCFPSRFELPPIIFFHLNFLFVCNVLLRFLLICFDVFEAILTLYFFFCQDATLSLSQMQFVFHPWPLLFALVFFTVAVLV